MIRLIGKYGGTSYLSISWTLLTIFLLCLPGENFPPEEKIFAIKHLDKLVHAALFGILVLFWSLYAYRSKTTLASWQGKTALIAAGSIILGIALEYVQRYFIPFRDFELGDIVADSVGSLGVYWFLTKKGLSSGLLLP